MWPRGLFFLGEFMNNFNAQIKPALTFNQQLDHLINDKGLIVNNYDNALSILKHENYYRLSGYMIDFLDKNDSGNLKITNLDRLIFTKNGEFTI